MLEYEYRAQNTEHGAQNIVEKKEKPTILKGEEWANKNHGRERK